MKIDSPARHAPLEMDPDEFRLLGHELVEKIAGFLEGLPAAPVTPHETVSEVRALLDQGGLPDRGVDPAALLAETGDLLFAHSLFNGHPGFLGYITSPAAPIGILAEFLAAAVNQNVGGFALAPLASEIERQTVGWLAEMVGFPVDAGGLLVSGGNTANFIGVLAARRAKLPWDAQRRGMAAGAVRPTIYVSEETHTWVQKAADQYGFGNDAVRWIPTDAQLGMDVGALHRRVAADLAAGMLPLMVVGTAGSTSTGAIDPLPDITELCREHDLWFHVDGAYGAFATLLRDPPAALRAIREADSLALDPHKWLYAPLEAGCVLVRDAEGLRDTFSYTPPYYELDGADGDAQPIHYYEYGPQNSRGFRALKVWLAIRQVGREGYARMIAEDIRLAGEIYRLADAHLDLDALTTSLSITTFRYRPRDLDADDPEVGRYLDALNHVLLERLQIEGRFYPTHAIVRGRYAIRPCIVNFRTSQREVEGMIDAVVRLGGALDGEQRPDALAG